MGGMPAVIFFLAALAVPAAAAEEDLSFLLEGVEWIGAPGIPGPLCVYGDGAFPVVTGAVDGGLRAPAVAAMRLGAGRIVAFGKDGYLAEGGLSMGDTGRFVRNAVRWTCRRLPASRVTVGVRGNPALASYLSRSGFKARELKDADWPKRILTLHVVCVNSHSLAEEDYDPLRRFVREGGGLLIEGLGWGWLSLNPGKDLVRDHPANRLLGSEGIAWADGYLEPTIHGGFAARPFPGRLTHAARALTEAAFAASSGEKGEGAPARGGRPGDSAQAGWTLMTAVRSLPPADRGFLERLKNSLRRYPYSFPSPDEPIEASQPHARIMTALEHARLTEFPPDGAPAYGGAAAFPGAVPPKARKRSVTLQLSAGVPGWRGTGRYALPGEVVTVKLPKRAAAKGLKLRIGAHTDTIWHKDSWRRFPEISRDFPLDSARTRAASPFGGLIYIEVPEKCRLGSLEVRLQGAVPAPLYVHGETDLREWRRKIRFRPAPWAEIGSGKIILTVPSDLARGLESPDELMDLWGRIMDAYAELAGIPPERGRPERLVADVQISAGYMHAGYPIMTHLDGAGFMLDRERLAQGSWGLFHEIGHNHQEDDWTFAGTGEVTCNLFTLYLYETVCGHRLGESEKDHLKRYLPREAARTLKAYLKGGPDFEKWKADPFLGLLTYVQLRQAFGWEAFRRVFAEYRGLSADERPKTDDEKRDQWLVRFSRAAGRNLGPFFSAWGIPTSAAARAAVADLPAWMPEGFPKQRASGARPK